MQFDRSAGGQHAAQRPATEQARSKAATSPPHRVLELQRMLGNQALMRLVTPRLQPQLRVGPADDVYEREADRVADHVMRMPMPEIQRACSQCEQDDKREDATVRRYSEPGSTLHRDATSTASMDAVPDVPAIVHDVLRESGQPLDSGVRAFMEPRFGYDFSGVRVHTGGRAAQSARAIEAVAYTVGRNLVFDEGAYRPDTDSGRRLLAHELTHVVQQGGASASVAPTVADGGSARRQAIEQPSTSPCLQARWRLDRVTPTTGSAVRHVRENGSGALAILNAGSSAAAAASARAWQEWGWVHAHVGGEAQFANWTTTRFTFRHEGDDYDFLQLNTRAELEGRAKAQDLRYARAGAAVWGTLIERSPSNPTPPSRQMFEIHDGGISTATVGDLGEIEIEVPIGEGTGRITIPLRHAEEGSFAPFSQARHQLTDVASGNTEVDVLLGTRVEADADIETEFFGLNPLISQNVNNSSALGSFQLLWESRPAPAAAPAPTPAPDPGTSDPDAEIEAEDRFKGDCYAGRSCDGRILARRVLHCHNCKRRFSGRSIRRPDGTCERC